jgi:catechol 2,3-dioxygenase-like lactoylglutathione lyase family enzyme
MVPVGVRFELFVDDVERSLAFYGAVLGLRPSPGYDKADGQPVFTSSPARAAGTSVVTRADIRAASGG